MYVKFKGNMQYLFATMDDETRLGIAQQVSANKGTSDVQPMFQGGRESREEIEGHARSKDH